MPDPTAAGGAARPGAEVPGAGDEAPLVHGRPDPTELTDQLLSPEWVRSRGWRILFGISVIGTIAFAAAVGYTLAVGTGIWGNNIPVAWAYPIVNFVWWIGIGHAGTFISAFLLLMNQDWRASVNRVAEAMTLIALINASIFPLLHLGRPWFFYWLLPYPSTLDVWPQFKSALPWDVAAVGGYFIISLLFWYVGLIPDLATARDRARGRIRAAVYGIFSLGWSGSAREWYQHRFVYVLLAGLAAPLTVSVHTIVSLDFAITQIPGWHSTIFPPYFVVGAIYSGLAMALVLLLPLRHVFGLENVITRRHLDHVAKLILAAGWLLIYSYAIEIFIAWYGADMFDRYTYLFERPVGPYAWIYGSMTAINVLVPQLFWSERARESVPVLFGASALIVVAMWAERFIIVISSLHRDFLPSSWAFYAPTPVDWTLLLGSVAFFLFLFLLMLRYVPAIPISELQRLQHERLRGETPT